MRPKDLVTHTTYQLFTYERYEILESQHLVTQTADCCTTHHFVHILRQLHLIFVTGKNNRRQLPIMRSRCVLDYNGVKKG